jgi:hypothetical protein
MLRGLVRGANPKVAGGRPPPARTDAIFVRPTSTFMTTITIATSMTTTTAAAPAPVPPAAGINREAAAVMTRVSLWYGVQ